MILYRIGILLGRPLARILFRPRVRGRHHVPRVGGVVLAPTHLSSVDAGALAYALPSRSLRQMAKNQLFRHRVLGPLAASLGAFPARTAEFRGGVEKAVELARRGSAIVIFPEGARRRGRKHRARAGAARTALAAGVPLVPVALCGTDRWRRLGRWDVAFGPPVRVDDLVAADAGQAAREATRRLWNEIVRLEGELAKPDHG